MAFESLPVIDISAFTSEKADPVLRKETAQKIHEAARDVGFFYVTGHNVPQEVLDNVMKEAFTFFSSPKEMKDEISMSKTSPCTFRGYQRLGENVTQYQRDWHEGVDYFYSVPEDGSVQFLHSFPFAQNPWPSFIPTFRPAVERYIQETSKVGRALMTAMAIGLGLEETFFEKYISHPFWGIRLIGYPPLQSASDQEIGISCGEHSDYGCVTILFTDDTKGALQVKNTAGQWIQADPYPGAFVINLGDMLKIWTKGLYQSTPHRVIHKGNNYRVSIPLFFEPNFDAMIEPLESIQGNPELKDVAPRRYADHVWSKVSNNFTFSTQPNPTSAAP